jgi:hypothetical protein
MNPDPIRFIHPGAISDLFALRQSEDPISWRTFGVGVALATFMDKEGKCYPSRATVAKRTKLHPREVSRALAELRKRGFIQVEARVGSSNCYSQPLVESTLGEMPSPGEIAQDPFGENTQDPPGGITQGPLGEFATQKEVMNKPMKELPRGGTGKAHSTSTEAIPEEISGLELYEADLKLCRAWPELLTSWERAYPGFDINTEIAKAHAWEVANPSRRKKDRPRFLTNWLARASDKPQSVITSAHPHEEQFTKASRAYAESGLEDSIVDDSGEMVSSGSVSLCKSRRKSE